MKNKSTLFLVQAAAIGAVYVVVTLLFAPLSFGEVQIRFAEALTILPYFTDVYKRQLVGMYQNIRINVMDPLFCHLHLAFAHG